MKRFAVYLIVAFLVVCIGLVGFAGPAHAALIFHSGFEIGDFSEWNSVSGSPAVVDNIKKTGDYAMRCSTDATEAYVTADSGLSYRATFYLYIASTPTSDSIILGDSTSSCHIVLNDDRHLELHNSVPSLIDTGSSQLSLDSWYKISFSGDADINGIVKVYLNGNEEISGNSGVGKSANILKLLGVISSVTADLYFDDYAFDRIASTVDIGDIRVLRAMPNAVGEYAQYDTSSGYTNVNSWPNSDASFVEDEGADAARESYNIEGTADLGISGSAISAVNVFIRGDRDGGGATDHMAMVRDDSVDYNSADLDFDGIAWYSWYHADLPNGGAPWTVDRFNALQIGAYHSGAQDQRVHSVLAMVAYASVVPPTVTTQAVDNTLRIKALGHGTITNTGGVNCSKRGVCWNTTGSPTVADSKSEETDSFGTGTFSRQMTGLSAGEHYYVKAYAYNLGGYGYGSQVEFDTLPVDCEVLFPNTAGSETSIASQDPGSGSHYDKVDEEFYDDENTLIFTYSLANGYERDLYNLPASSGSGTIARIVVHFRCFSGSIDQCHAKASIRSNTTVTDGIEKTFAADYTWEDFSQEWPLNPADSGAWEWSDIDALQIGVSLISEMSLDEIECTQVYVVVYYPDGAADISNAPSSKAFSIVTTSTTYWSNGSEPTWPLVDGDAYFTVTNNGDQCSITIEATNFTGGVGWTLGTPGENIVRLTSFKEGDGSGDGVTLTTSPQSFITGLITNIDWELKMETPTSHTDGAEKTSILTLTATLD